MIFFHNMIFFFLSLSCSSVFSTVLTFDGNKIQTPEVFFFCFLPRRCDSFELSVVFPAPCFGRKCGNCVILLQVRVLFSCTFVFYGNFFNLSQKISLSFLGLICILKKYFKGPKLLNVRFPHLLHYKADPHSHFNIV